MISVALAMLVSAPASGKPCTPFSGGPAQGMCLGPILEPGKTFNLVAVLPAPRRGPPISRDVSALLSEILESQRKGIPLPSALVADGAESTTCSTFYDQCQKREKLVSWPIGPEFTANAPYLLSDGQIRIEWVKGGKLEYLSFVMIDAGKVTHISTVPAAMPMKASR